MPINTTTSEVLPYTFEDSLIFENKTMLDEIGKENAEDKDKKIPSMIKKVRNITDAQSAFDTIRNTGFKKAEFALDLLYLPNFDELKIPTYISEGLHWLEGILQPKLAQTPLVKNNMEANNVA